MKTIFDHIESVKEKPHHVRKRVAFSAAGAGTALVALVWLVGSVSSGNFALKDSSFADTVAQGSVIVTGDDATTGLAGAAAALDTSSAARIEIVDTRATTSTQRKAEQTIIPF